MPARGVRRTAEIVDEPESSDNMSRVDFRSFRFPCGFHEVFELPFKGYSKIGRYRRAFSLSYLTGLGLFIRNRTRPLLSNTPVRCGGVRLQVRRVKQNRSSFG